MFYWRRCMSEMIVLDTPEQIRAYGLLVLRSRLKLEVLTGMPFSNRISTTNAVRREIGSKTRSKKKLLEEFITYLKEKGILKDGIHN